MTKRITELYSPDVREMLTGISSSWFRLFTLQRYNFPSEDEMLQEFLRTGESGKLPEQLIRLIEQHVAAGHTLERVFIVREPLTDYLRFALSAYASCAVAGEDIRVLPVQGGDWPADLPEGYDYWLVDDNEVLVMEFDQDDSFVALQQVVHPATIAQCRRWRDIALGRSVPLLEYAAAASIPVG